MVKRHDGSKPVRGSGVSLSHSIFRNWQLYLFILPAVAHIFIFKYLPIYGIRIAFTDGFTLDPELSAPLWNNFAHFLRFVHSAFFWNLLRNTVFISLYGLVLFPVPIILALLLNSVTNEWFKKTVQMATYAPYFISSVVVVSMLLVFLSPRNGVVNTFIKLLGQAPVNFFAEPAWGPTLYVLSDLWQTAGYNAIIYLAALSTVDLSSREAAYCDGANRFQIIWHVDLPWISSTVLILFLLRVGQMLSMGFEKILLMQNDLTLSTMEVISTYVYKSGILNGQYDYATAVGLIQAGVDFLILVTANSIAKKVSGVSLW